MMLNLSSTAIRMTPVQFRSNWLRLGLVLAAAIALPACSKSADSGAAPPPDASPATPAAPAAPTPSVTAQKAPADAKVDFVGVKDGDTVTSPFTVGFSVTGLKVAAAGTADPGTGHFHLIIDSDLPPAGAPLPATEQVKHYGKGQTEDTLTLAPGLHTLQIEFADGSHVPFDPPVVSAKISVTVK